MNTIVLCPHCRFANVRDPKEKQEATDYTGQRCRKCRGNLDNKTTNN